MKIAFIPLLLLAATLSSNLAAKPLDSFELGDLVNGGTVNMQDYQGSIILLDFFAHWCSPCRKSTPLIESKIGEYYKTQNGNPAGITVHALPVNIDISNPKRTERFVKALKLTHALEDTSGELYETIAGNRGIPFFAVIDATGDQFQLIYDHAGFEGIEKLRSVIDSVK